MLAKAPLAALVVVLLLFAVPGAASALRRIQMEPAGRLTRTIREMRFRTRAFEISVDVTLIGTWNRAIEKRVGAEAGRITSARTANCRVIRPAGATCTAEVVVEERRPITKVFRAFTGTLPNITGIRTGQRFDLDVTITPGPSRCEYAGEVGFESMGNPIGGEVVTEGTLGFVSGEMLCATEAVGTEGFAVAEPRQRLTLV